ncbi:HAD hydrolase-like protein [Amylibacter sp.]|nr:HAD hydrolase-like protein [Amylibacter sp.]
MKKALLFGSIGVLTETSELQRRAYNMALKLNDIKYIWNIGTYCELLKKPGGKKRLSSFGDEILSDEQIEKIHTDKQRIFENLVKDGIEPRPGCLQTLKKCKELGIKVGFVTTTTPKTINIIKEGLSNFLNFEDFDLITSNQRVALDKPNPEVYEYALKELGISANDAVAIEDTTVNQSCAVQSGIECHLFPGEYATVGYKDMVGKKFISEKLEFSEIIF